MIHARKDYNRIQDPAVSDPSLLSDGATPIGEDEPVFLLRAQDKAAPHTLQHWAFLQPDGSPAAELAWQWAKRMKAWQAENGSKIADVHGEDLAQ